MENRILQFSLYVTAKDGKLSCVFWKTFDGRIYGCVDNYGYITVGLNTTALPLHTLGGGRSTSAMVDVKAPGDSHPQFLQKTYHGQVEEDQSEADIVKVFTSTNSFFIRSSMRDCFCN